MPVLELKVASGDALKVHRFSVNEAVNSLFSISILARFKSPMVDLEAIVGRAASFKVVGGTAHVKGMSARLWTGIISFMEQVHGVQPGPGAEELSTYHLRLVPQLWLLTQRRNHRIFQHKNVPDIVDEILGEWKVEKKWKVDRGQYPKLEYQVQYGETDYSFISRLLEEAGIAFTFPDDDENGSKVEFNDKLESNPPRPGDPLPYVDNPNKESEKEFVSSVRLSREVRPGAYSIRDYDFRRPAFELFGEAPKQKSPEDAYEQYLYMPGSFLVEGGKGGGTPVADDKGVARHEQSFGKDRAERWLMGERMGKRAISFAVNTIDLWPGQIFLIDKHPHPEITESTRLLVTEFSMDGSSEGEWTMMGHSVFADVAYRPPQKTMKPRVEGLQSATVVGPSGQEIYTDEFGRVRVQFPWDRLGKHDDNSSCWMRVSQGWAGAGYGMMTIPRVGQEVLVAFLEGDPDQPLIVGRVYNVTQTVPYKLPDHKTRSTWKSDSSKGSDGFNEIMFEDLKGKELVYEQAQKNRRRLVKNDETITIGANRQRLVKGNETIRVDGGRTKFVGGDEQIVVKKAKRERVEKDSHLKVKGSRKQKIDGSQSLTIDGDQQEKIGKKHAVEAGKEIHLKAGDKVVLEAGVDLTIKGPGGFMRIDAGGVVIKGNLVKINSGGSPGSGSGSSPEEAEDAVEAGPEDVGRSGIGQ